MSVIPCPSASHLAGVLLATLVSGCTPAVSTTISNPRPFAPPVSYAQWWSDVQSCAAREGRMDRIEWFVAEDLTQNGRLVLGRWEEPHRITILAGYTEAEAIVKHEMLHDLLNGDPDHTDAAWAECGLADVG